MYTAYTARPFVLLSALAACRASPPLLPDAPASTPRAWEATIADSAGVELVVRMRLEFPTAGRWEAYSRPGGLRSMLSRRDAIFGKLLGKLPPHNALMFGSGEARPAADSVVLRGVLESPILGNRHFSGSLRGSVLRAELRRGDSTTAVVGRLLAHPLATSAPRRDYAAIASAVRDTMTRVIYDPRVIRSRNYQGFFAELTRRLGDANDDLDAVAAFYALKPRLGTSHLEFIRNPRLAATPFESLIAGDPAVDPASLVTLRLLAPGLAYLRVSKWDRVGTAITRAFARIDSAGVEVLVLDIRGNSGGDASSISPAAHLFRDTVSAGFFLARRWYDSHCCLPDTQEMSEIPQLTSATGPSEFFHTLRERGALLGKVVPSAPYYAGLVYLLTDRGTASASEPLTHLLKTSGRATVIGERTAGAMLTALPHPVGDGFIVVVPQADYYAADRTRLEGHGVQPHRPATSAGSLLVTGELIKQKLPYAGAVFLATTHTALRRWTEAERYWRDALALAPNDSARTSIRSRIMEVSGARP